MTTKKTINETKEVLLAKLHRGLKMLEEAQQPLAPQPSPMAPPPAPSPEAAPPAPTPGDSGETPIGVDGDPLTVDAIIGRLNVIRGGKSFNDPEVYGQLTTFFKGLGETDKSTLDRVLAEIGKIVINVPQNQTEPEPGQTPQAPPPAPSAQMAPPAPAAGGAAAAPPAPSPMMEENVLLEQRKANVSVVVNGKSVDFGSKPHVDSLKTMLESLATLKECYEQGSSTRTDLSRAVTRVRRILEKLEKAVGEETKPVEVLPQ